MCSKLTTISITDSRYKALRTASTQVSPNSWYRAVSQRAPVTLERLAAVEGKLIHSPKPEGPEIEKNIFTGLRMFV